MSDLNEFECELLDTLLGAFGVPDSLTRLQVLDLFGQDEAAAFAMVQILLREDLIKSSGSYGEFELPERLILKPKGEKFLSQGGFTRRFRDAQQKPVEVGGTLAKLQQQNMRLQNLKLSLESEVSALKKQVSIMRQRQLILLIALALSCLFCIAVVLYK
ncbi:hypothetical protein EOD41_03380 [Mucilaginibacter limnophilus]|uniref:Uncharacterized protein n=1 Tax=Mucilaginibacter limnophilus TaxID=1932778 RepID=A0A437MZC9_9SPHI|nr:hypothetical protein [Mucilaginibacter limnophilus]RVU02989.1 hypothetical protein EOD41_03380 [Mucilaginibacter limnophilus]